MEPTEICWKFHHYSDDCDCELCDHKSECSGYDSHDDDDDE